MNGVIVTSDDISNQFQDELPEPEDRIEKPLVAHDKIRDTRIVLDGPPSDRSKQFSISRNVTTPEWIISMKYKESNGFYGRNQKVKIWAINRNATKSFHKTYAGSGSETPSELFRESYQKLLEEKFRENDAGEIELDTEDDSSVIQKILDRLK